MVWVCYEERRFRGSEIEVEVMKINVEGKKGRPKNKLIDEIEIRYKDSWYEWMRVRRPRSIEV